MKNDFVVTPWEVKGEIDYDKLVERFGTQRITEKLLGRMKRHTKLHPMLRRNIFYSQIRSVHGPWSERRYAFGSPDAMDIHQVPAGRF